MVKGSTFAANLISTLLPHCCVQIQNWMADQMLELQRSTPDLGISVHDLRRVGAL